MTRSAISVISNFALTGPRTSTSSPSLRKRPTNSCRLFAGTINLLYRGPDPSLGTLLALTGDDSEELRQMRCPDLYRDRVAARDLAGPVPNHVARHPDEAWLVQPRYRLDRPSISVVPNEYRLVRRHPGRVVCPESILQVSQSLSDGFAPVVLRNGQAFRSTQKDLLK